MPRQYLRSSTTRGRAPSARKVSPYEAIDPPSLFNVGHKAWVDPSPLPVPSANKSCNPGTYAATVAGLVAGDVLTLADGDYSGLTTIITAAGTAGSPIYIRALNRHGARFTGASRIEFSNAAAYIKVSGLLFEDVTLTKAVLMQGTNHRITDCIFRRVGDSAGGSSTGMIYFSNPNWTPTGDGLPAPTTLVTNNQVDSCIFVSPRNAVCWWDHGCLNNRFLGNWIIGPTNQPANDSYVLKFGFGAALDASNLDVSFNTIGYVRSQSESTTSDYQRSSPYTIGFKQSSVLFSNNLIYDGRTEFRYSNNCTVRGNVILNGDINIGGTGHLIENNYIRVLQSKDGYGGFLMYTDFANGDTGDYEGVILHKFGLCFKNSTVRSNTFVGGVDMAGPEINAVYVAAPVSGLLAGNGTGGQPTHDIPSGIIWNDNLHIKMATTQKFGASNFWATLASRSSTGVTLGAGTTITLPNTGGNKGTLGLRPGLQVSFVSGTGGITGGTTISSITNSTQLVLSAAPSSTGTATIRFDMPLSMYQSGFTFTNNRFASVYAADSAISGQLSLTGVLGSNGNRAGWI